MAPSVQQTQETSNFEILYQVESEASASAKVLRIIRNYKSISKAADINIYAYINTESQMNSIIEKRERATMQTRFNYLRNYLIQMGVPNDNIYIGGVAYSSNWGGQIHISVKELNLNSGILPPYTPTVPTNPQTPPNAKEQWIDADGSVKKDVLKGELALEIELTFKEGGIFKTKPPVSIKASVKETGAVELGAEWTAIEEEIKKKAFYGAISEVKFKVSGEATTGFKIDGKQLHTEVNAALKASLSAVLIIPKTSIKIPVEVSVGVGINGEPVVGLQTTYKW